MDAMRTVYVVAGVAGLYLGWRAYGRWKRGERFERQLASILKSEKYHVKGKFED